MKKNKKKAEKKSSDELITITRCRVCGKQKFKDIISLGNLHMSDFIDSDKSHEGEGYPLDLIICDRKNGGCGLVQLRHGISPHAMYRNYWYMSGVNKTMVEELTDIAHIAERIARPQAGDIVLDIGSNDSTLLRAYEHPGVIRVGFEPAKNLMQAAQQGSHHVFNDFFSKGPYQKKYKNAKAKIITAIAMFYDLEDPNSFIRDVATILDPNGVFVIQMTDLPSMLMLNAFDNICHEHLEYYSLDVLKFLLKRHDLEVFDVESNDVNGGSLRAYIRHVGSRVGDERFGKDIRHLERVALEEMLGLQEYEIYEKFAADVKRLGDSLVSFIHNEKKKGKNIYVYGASTKGNTLLQYFNLTKDHISAAAERNPMKWGKKTIRTNIPIVSEEDARKGDPHYFLVLPWHFLKEFIEREHEFFASGGKFIVPLPEFKVIGREELGISPSVRAKSTAGVGKKNDGSKKK